MSSILEYKGYHTRVEYDSEDMVLRGKIEGINDYVDFVSSGTEAFELEQRRFIVDHGVDEKYADSNGYLAARCHVISFGYKNEVGI